MAIGRGEVTRDVENGQAAASGSVRVVAWEWDVARDVVTTTNNLQDIYGVPTVDVAEAGFSLVHPDDIARHRSTVEQAVATGTGYQSVFRVVRPDNGAVVWLEERAAPEFDEAGNVRKLIGVTMDVTAHRQADEVVGSQAALVDLTFDAVFVRDFATDIIRFWNRGAEELYGYTRDEVIGRVSHDVLRTVHPIPLDEARQIVEQTGRWDGELVHTRKDGTRVAVQSRWAVQMDQGRPVAILETNTDLTARVQAEDERTQTLISEREARMQAEDAQRRLALLAEASALLASSLDYETTLRSVAWAVVPRIADWCSVHLVDEDGTVRQVTVTHPDPAKVEFVRALEERYPYDPNAPAGVPQVLRTGQAELMTEVPEGLFEAVAPDQELLQILRELGIVSWMVVPLSARGRLLGAITLVAAESGRHYGPDDLALAEVLARRAALAVDNARLYREATTVAAEQTAILAQIADGVALVDCEGRLTFLNEAARRLTGNDARGPLGSVVEQFGVRTLDGEPYPVDQIPLTRALRNRETVVDARWLVQRKDGVDIAVEGSAAPVVSESGELLGAVATFRDVTEHVALERQKEEFLAAAAHDLKTPLTSVRGLAQLLHRRVARSDVPDSEKIREGLERIEQSASRMTALINELLDLSRLQEGGTLELNRRAMDLVALVQRSVREYDEDGIPSRIVVEASVPELVGRWDGDRLERVVVNLLSNAVKYSKGEDPIVVRLGAEEGDGVECAVLSVEDHGIGIPAEDLPRIFERFHRGRNVGREKSGTGIGLSGAKLIVEQHGGSIDVRSEEGLGSTFTVRIPLETDMTDDGVDADRRDD